MEMGSSVRGCPAQRKISGSLFTDEGGGGDLCIRVSTEMLRLWEFAGTLNLTKH